MKEKNKIGVHCPTPKIWQKCKTLLQENGESVKNLIKYNKLYPYIVFDFGAWGNVTMLCHEEEISLDELKTLLKHESKP